MRCFRAQELCESRGGRPGLPSLINLRFLWTDVKQRFSQREMFQFGAVSKSRWTSWASVPNKPTVSVD